jgi:hypothetical protein
VLSRVVGEDEFGEIRCAVAPVTLPSSGSREPVITVPLEFAADLFQENLREKDLEPISLELSTRRTPPGNCSSVVSSSWAFWIAARRFLKSADVGRVVGEGVIGEANSASVILAEESCDRFLRKAKIGEAFAIGLADQLVCPLRHALTFFETLTFIDELFSSIRVIAKNDHVGLGGCCLAVPDCDQEYGLMFLLASGSTRLCRDVPSPWRNAVLFG